MRQILLTGKEGQVGFELQRSLAVLGQVFAVGRGDCDLADPIAIRNLIARVQPDIIVNPAAYTAVDRAESEPGQAHAINTVAPAILAAAAAEQNALLIHYSTDYVFDGAKTGPYAEDDLPNPRSVYGKTKYAGEAAIRAAHDQHLILRTSWVFGAHGSNFLKTILRLAQERDQLRIIVDQYGAPTAASLLADVTAQIIARYLQAPASAEFPFGTYHLAAAGETTWHGYAQTVCRLALQHGYTLKIQPEQIEAIASSAYPLPAPRPANSRLDSRKLQQVFGLRLPDWQQGVAQVMALLAH